MSKVVLVTGGFDPLHSGHIAYFKAARELGDHLVVGLNSDEWLTRKKGKSFMSMQERAAIVKELSCVDEIIAFNDNDNTACAAITQVLSTKGSSWKVLFANGGDRTNTTTPEYALYGDHRDVEFVFGVGGEDKKNSSSWILENWKKPTVQREWGSYTILDNGDGWQVKQLAFDAGKALSDQRHFTRSEHWHVVEGNVEITLQYDGEEKHTYVVRKGHSLDIPALCWHKAVNNDEKTVRVIEVWLGNELTEDDIERRD